MHKNQNPLPRLNHKAYSYRVASFLGRLFLGRLFLGSLFLSNLFFLSLPTVAQAQNADVSIFKASGKSVVTSLGKCLDQLDDADAIDIRTNYLKPWSECQKRLEAKKRQEQTATAGDTTAESAEAIPETPRNYVRVQQTPKNPNKADDQKTQDAKGKEKAKK